MALGLVTAGESHGPALVAIVSGLPAGLPLTGAIDADLRGGRRVTAAARASRSNRQGRGARGSPPRPHARDAARARRAQPRPQELDVGDEAVRARGRAARQGRKPVTLPRPGHADLAGVLKYGLDDVRNALERASARHTAGTSRPARSRRRCSRRSASPSPAGRRDGAARGDDGMRGRSTPRARTGTRSAASSRSRRGLPPGLGSYAQKDDRLDARLASAVMGIQAVKGVEIGDGFALAAPAAPRRTTRSARPRRGTNRAGGIEAGCRTARRSSSAPR